MQEPRGVEWREAGFRLTVPRHSAWSAVLGIAGTVALLVLAGVGMGQAFEGDERLLFALPAALVVGFGAIAVLAQRAEHQMKARDEVEADAVRVRVNGQELRFENVIGVEWKGPVLTIQGASGEALTVWGHQLREKERAWLLHHLTALWLASRDRRGDVPAALRSLRQPE